MEASLTKGQRVRVKELSYSLADYPFLPNLLGRTGVIVDNKTTMCVVKFDQPFQMGVVPPKMTNCIGYIPEQWVETDEYTLFEDELELEN